ncbi:MAG: hypothetical protein ACREXY_06260 [Gammaproteobacteria bacterium]
MKRIDPLKLSLQHIAEATGESLPTLYSAINAGDLETFLVGRRRFARPEAVRAWVDRLEAASNAGKPISYRARSTERRAA